jgi:hypothetical protein
VNGHVEAWRSTTGGYFCDEFCAEDEEDAFSRSQEGVLTIHGTALQNLAFFAPAPEKNAS